VAWNIQPHPRSKLRKSRAIPLLPLWAFMACSKANITFYSKRYNCVFYFPFKCLYFISPFLRKREPVSKTKNVIVLYKDRVGTVFKQNNIKHFLKIFFMQLIFNLI